MSSSHEVAIHADGLSKSYRIRQSRSRSSYRTLQEEIIALPRRAFGALRGQSGTAERFWALEDVSFEVRQGEVLGIIGRNGAGKSTLLKIVSRITEPTRGYAELHGRVGTLLEVGTGFHPELTGRENIFLSGAILGMRRAEIRRRFDEIVEFAEVERFVETPVKHYSSGMYMRLAFSVAAHLDPEILVVDEVLAVGDASFQKKCLGKMDEVAHAGRTVLFVSHNIGAVRSLCHRVVWLEGGRIKLSGPSADVTQEYTSRANSSQPLKEVLPSQHRTGHGDVQVTAAAALDRRLEPCTSFLVGEPMALRFEFKARRPTPVTFWMIIYTDTGTPVFSSFQRDGSDPIEVEGSGAVSVEIRDVSLLPGRYTLSAGAFDSAGNFADWAEEVADLEILPHFADGRAFDGRLGLMTKDLTWQMSSG